MAKIKAPLFSLDATGTLDKNITYKGKLRDQIAQKYSKPGDKNPFESSPRQKDQRSIIRLITIHWQCMSSADQLSWNNAAKDARFKGTGYHYFLSKAQQNLTQYLGLVGYWSMNYNIDEKIPDLSGNGNHGILSPIFPCDCPTLVDSFNKKEGKSAFFDGNNDYIYTTSDSLTGDGPFTIEVVFKMKDPPADYIVLFSKKTASLAIYAYIFYIAPSHFLKFWITGLTPSSLTGTIPISTFYTHAVYIYDGSNIRIFINGFEDPASPLPVTGLRDNFVIPNYIGRGLTGLHLFAGFIDSATTWNFALDKEEILKHYLSYNF